jgi:predicted RNA-binding Zn-ribbon protein involved in translation (DUF1610 family)
LSNYKSGIWERGLKLIETLKNLRIVKGRQGLKLCPKCGKPSLRLSSALNGWLIPEEYVCLECGYRGPIILEIQ